MPLEQLTDQRKIFKNTLTIHDQLLFHYVPLIGGNAFYLYLIYCSLAEKYQTVFPSFDILKKQTGFSFESIAKYNRILAEIGLIQIKRNNQNNSNHYYLIDPPEITREMKKTYLKDDFCPIIKCISVLGISEDRYSEKPSSGTPKNRGPVLGISEGNNKDLVVVNSNKTTTMQTALESITSLLESVVNPTGQPDELIKSSESILKSALKHSYADPEKAVQFIQEKCESFQKQIARAKDKLAFIHAIVANNWRDMTASKRQADQKIVQESRKAEDFQQKAIMDSWQKLKPEIRASYLSGYIKNYFRVKKRNLSDKELKEALNTLTATGRYGNFNLDIPPLDFKGEN